MTLPIDLENLPKVRAFLADLAALSAKYHITIGGCGCCGSPWLKITDPEVPELVEYYDHLGAELLEAFGE